MYTYVDSIIGGSKMDQKVSEYVSVSDYVVLLLPNFF